MSRPHVSPSSVVDFMELAEVVLTRPPRLGPVRLIAVDGPGGAGKSVFAGQLAAALGGAPVVHTDDFAAPDDQFDWWPVLERDVLAPLQRVEAARFARRDWATGGIGPSIEVPAAPCVILEGVSSGRRAVADRISLLVWLETGREIRLARGIERDGEAMRGQWLTWMAEEDRHYAADLTVDRADVVVDGAPGGGTAHDPARSFVAIRWSS